MARRELFSLIGVLGIGFVTAACGGSKGVPVTAVSTSPNSSGGGSSGPTGYVAVTNIGGAHVAADRALTTADAQRVAAQANGQWQGGWLDSAGHTGNADVMITLDVSSRTARASLSFTGPLLGSSVPAQRYDIDLLSFMLTADSYDVASPQFGTVTISPGGATSATASAVKIPGHPEIASISVSASRLAKRVDLTYTLSYTDGHVVKGAMALSSAGEVAQPHLLPSPGAAPNPTDIASGAYAAGLLTGNQVSTTMGGSFAAPQPNGGRLLYDTGIDVSNARSTGASETVAYTVQVAHAASDMAALWTKELAGQPAIAGPWKAAFWYPTIQTLYVYATDTRGLQLQINPAAGGPPPTTSRQTQWPDLCQKLAAQIITNFGQ